MDSLTVTNCFLNALLMLVSVVGNTVVLAAIFMIPSLRSPAFIFLCSLAISDLFVGLIMQPVYIAQELKPVIPLRLTANMLFSIGCGVSLCTMTAISVDRFLALQYHMRYPNMMTRNRAMYASATIWFIAIILSCLGLWHQSHAVLAVGIATCILVSTFCYIKIYKIVRQHHSQIYSQQLAAQSVGSEHNLNLLKSTRSAINTFIYYICMILCYSPMFTSMLIYAIKPTLSSKPWTLANTVVFMNSSINPILYCWRLRELRAAVFKILPKKLSKQTEES